MGKKSKRKKMEKMHQQKNETPLTAEVKKSDPAGDRFSLGRHDLLICVSVFVLTLACYILTLTPTIFFGDSGEFITASYHLGIVHPPGYPLYTLFGKLFMTIIPFGDIAYRMNLMSAIFASAAAAVFFILMRILGAGRFISAVSVLLMAFSQTFWSSAVATEVYSLNALFFCLILTLFCFWLRNGDDKKLVWLAFICGLALTHHITIAAFYPAILLGVLIKKPSIIKDIRLLTKLILAAVLPLLLYLYLPIRSAANPPTDWGNPETFKAMLNHITAKQYSGKLFEHGFQGIEIQLKAFLDLIFKQFTPYLLVLVIPGIIFLFRKAWRFLLWLSIFLLINIAYAVSYFIVDIDAYFIPAFILTAVFIGFGLQALVFSMQSTKGILKHTALASIFVVALIPPVFNWKICDHSGNFLARNFGENILKTVAKNGIFLSHGDNESFITAYLTLVEGQRKDITVYDRTQNLLPYPIVKEKGTVNRPAISEYERNLVFNSSKPVYFNFDPDDTYPLKEEGLLFRVVRGGDMPSKGIDPWKTYDLEGLEDKSLYDDFMTRFVVSKYYEAYARYLWDQGKRNEADKYLEKALDVAGDQSTIFVAIGFFNIDKGRDNLAEKQLMKGLELNPFSSDCCNGLGTVWFNRGDYRKALEWYEKSFALDDKNNSSLINIGLASEKLGDNEKNEEARMEYYAKASESFRTVRENNPYNKQMERDLDRISEKFTPTRDVITKYEQQAAAEPENAVVRYDYGVYLAKQNMFEAAIRQFKLAIRANGRYVDAMTDMGGAYLKIRREDLAFEQFRKALEVDPDNKKARAGIEMIREAVKSGKVQMKIEGLAEK